MADEELMRMVVRIGANLDELQEGLSQANKHAKDTASALSFTGVAARKAMLEMANSSALAGAYMQQFNAMVGIVADTILSTLAPVLDPIMEFLWEMTEAFTELDAKHKMVVAAIAAIAVAMYLISAHPVIAAIGGIIILLMLMRRHWDEVTKAVNTILTPFRVLWDIFKKIDDVLWGHSLIPALEFMANIIKTALMPQIMILQGALEGIQLLLGGISGITETLVGSFQTAGQAITTNITNTFNFLGGAVSEFTDNAKDKLSSITGGLGGLF